jgi:hypothetical protein
MQTDRYTKFILTMIAIGLIANILMPLMRPMPAIAQANGKRWKSVTYSWTQSQVDEYLKQGYEPFAVDGTAVYWRK